MACINIPSLALQIALRRYPAFEGPLVLLAAEKPSSPILQLNSAARTLGLRPGMRYSEGLSLVGNLKAAVVSVSEVERARDEIFRILEHWSPRIEACPFEKGSFWVSSSGLAGLYGSEALWGAGIRSALTEHHYRATVVIGLTRGGTYVLARARRRSTVVRTWAAEKRAWETAPLSIFPLTLGQRRILERLGVTTLASLARIPPEDLARRWGSTLVQELQRWQASAQLPLQGIEKPSPWTWILRPEAPVSDSRALVALLDAPLDDGLKALRLQARLLRELQVVFIFETGELRSEILRPAEPTARRAVLFRLLDLRVSRIPFPGGVSEIRLTLQDIAEAPVTGELFARPPVRDLRRGAEALGWIRAQWGDSAVVHAVLVDSHVPESSYRWEEVDTPAVPLSPQGPSSLLTAVRRVNFVPDSEAVNPVGKRIGGPYRLQGTSGSNPMDREFWFLQNRRHEVLWVSWDRLTQRSRWEGVVD